MPLTAITKSGDRVFAPELEDKNQDFFCRFCKAPMIFVDATLKIKHFRHLIKASCDYEGETEEHENYKYSVYKNLQAIGRGKVFLEHPVGKLIADVYWERAEKTDIAFEIQATNYSISRYDEKIAYYAFRHVLVVYIFVGDDFCNEVRSNIYSLKEIEKRIFDENIYLDTVMGCYLNGDVVTKPSFSKKYAKGGDGYCTNRFIMRYEGTKEISLNEFLNEIENHVISNPYLPKCSHKETLFEKSTGKIPRYKIVCAVCKKFIKWLPNNEARNIGLDI